MKRQFHIFSLFQRKNFHKLTFLICCVIIVTIVFHNTFYPATHQWSTSLCKSGSCTHKSNIYFVKTHKTGGSTVQNVLMRFGLHNDLDFSLPKDGNHLVNHYNKNEFKGRHPNNIPYKELVPPSRRGTEGYNISCFHSVFNETIAAATVPAKDTVYVTILRDPVDAFESLYSFMKFDVQYGLSIEEFAFADKTLLEDDFFLQRTNNYMGVNQMLYDLGMDPHRLNDTEAVDGYIAFLEDRFHLVMIQESFDESMILLRDFMCWSTDDIIYLMQNARFDQHKSRRMSEEAAAIIRDMNSADQRLYDRFTERFQKVVKWYGRSTMAEEVEKFRKRMAEVRQACVEATVPPNFSVNLPPRFRPWSNLVSGFKLRPGAQKNETCEGLATAENPFVDKLREAQYKRAMLDLVQGSMMVPTRITT